MYELSAVLIHRGISAYSGHYIAHVKDACTGDWYKFNDEEIEKMEGKKLQLGIEEDIGKFLTGGVVGESRPDSTRPDSTRPDRKWA